MLQSLLVSWVVLALSVWVATLVVPRVRVRGGAGSYFVVAAVFGLLNVLLGWALYAFLGIATLGVGFVLSLLTRWVVNAIVLKIADALSDRLTVETFGAAMMASLVMSVVGVVAEWALRTI